MSDKVVAVTASVAEGEIFDFVDLFNLVLVNDIADFVRLGGDALTD